MLAATEEVMLPENSRVVVHCLYHRVTGQEPVLSTDWPLVHSINNKSSKQQISSLTSFYSSVTEPIFLIAPAKEHLYQLFFHIAQKHQWHSMQLGAFEEEIVAQALVEYFPYQHLFSKIDNVYQTGISDYANYYQ